jgi:hypothetical protein
MKLLRTIAGEIVHLFVDDGAFALALVLCSAGVGIAVRVLPGFSAFAGPILFATCAAVLLWNVSRSARTRR